MVDKMCGMAEWNGRTLFKNSLVMNVIRVKEG